jgi:metal-responsive CopG/Arc/MetJ family transcriptional regulator
MSAVCSTVMHMDAIRTEKISVNLTPELMARLDRFAERNRWTRSTAAALLIERGLPDEDAL